jgi:hypothetical protein
MKISPMDRLFTLIKRCFLLLIFFLWNAFETFFSYGIQALWTGTEIAAFILLIGAEFILIYTYTLFPSKKYVSLRVGLILTFLLALLFHLVLLWKFIF